jgi:DNA-binding transcriptional LysR family regulator
VNLDLFRLLVFVTVVDRGGYSAAGRRLNLTQSTVSHHVAELERACGAELVRYRDRSVHITAAGHEVYRAALKMLAEQEHLTASLADLKEGRRGRVRLGASMAFEQKHFFGHVIAHSRQQAQAVLDRDLDLAYVIRWHLPAEAKFEPLDEIELTFLASRGHPLAGGQPVTLDDLSAAGLITAPLTGAETGFYREALRASGLTGDHSVLEIDGQQARFLAAAAGLGVLATFVPDHARTEVFDDLVPLPVKGPLTRVEVGLVRPAEDPYSKTAQALAAWLRKPQPH